jgi:CRP-like cAMP-binding protein
VRDDPLRRDHRQQALGAAQREAVMAIARALAPLDGAAFEPVLRTATLRHLALGEALLQAGEPGAREYFVLDGVLRTWMADAQGREVTLAFHTGPGVLMPAITRTAGGCSRVHCQALTPASVAGFEAATLVGCMLADPAVQRWGDAVLRAELMRRVDREWALAALPAAERLQHFRAQFPGLEPRIAQRHVASYLGITPVSLSRLRAQERAGRKVQPAGG